MRFNRYRPAKTIILSPDATAYEAAQAMANRQVGAVVVADHGRVAGVVTDRDLAIHVVAGGKDPRTTPLDAIMRQPVATLDAEATVADAVAAMQANACRRLPLTSHGHVVGIVTLDDLLMDREIDADTAAAVVGAQLELAQEWAEHNQAREGSAPATVVGRHLRRWQRHRSHADSSYSRLLNRVEHVTGLKTPAEAETALLIALEGICRRVPPAQAAHLLAQLPSAIREELEGLDGPDKDITSDMLETELRRELHLDDLEAASVLSSVCKALAESVAASAAKTLRASLPAGMKELFPA